MVNIEKYIKSEMVKGWLKSNQIDLNFNQALVMTWGSSGLKQIRGTHAQVHAHIHITVWGAIWSWWNMKHTHRERDRDELFEKC